MQSSFYKLKNRLRHFILRSLDASECRMKTSTVTQRVKKCRKNLSAERKAEISRKNVERQRIRRQHMSVQQKQALRLHESHRRKKTRTKRSKEKRESDKAKNALSMKNKRAMKSIEEKFTKEQWQTFSRIAKLFPKEDTLNLKVSDFMTSTQCSSFNAAKELKEKMIFRLLQNHTSDDLFLDFTQFNNL